MEGEGGGAEEIDDNFPLPPRGALFCPYRHEDPAFRRGGRLANVRYGDQVRAIWVTRFDFHSPPDILRIMQHSARAGFNTVFFQVRGNASTYYPSKLEPWSEAFGWKDPGFDPLALAISEAHCRNMALHAWVNVMPMWRGSHPPSNSQHIYNSRPEWSWFNREGERQPLNRGFYVSINPCLPEARQHISKVCQEIASQYNIDGLHLDYIRFPNELPVTNGTEYSRDQRTLDLFKSDTRGDPDKDPELWDKWRCDCVTALLRDIRRSVKCLRPQLVLTAAVGADRKQALGKFQDVDRWWKERLLDAIVPMNYTGCSKIFRSRAILEWEKGSSNVDLALLYNGQFRESSLVHRAGWIQPPEPAVIMGASLEFGDSSLHQKQLSLALHRFGHFSVFCYSSLFGLGWKRCVTLLPYLKFVANTYRCLSFNHHLNHASEGPVHPADELPYDLLDIYDKVPADLVQEESRVRPVDWKLRRKITNYHRRTFRRRLLLKQTEGLPPESQKGAPLKVKEKCLSYLHRMFGFFPVKHWKALKTSKAIMEDENNLVTSGPNKKKNGGTFSFRFQVRIPQSEANGSKPWSCLCVCNTNQGPPYFSRNSKVL